MRSLAMPWRIVIALLAIPVGLALVIGLPLGLWYLVSFMSEWVDMLVFVPGFALYVLGVCVPLGLVQFFRWRGRRPSGPFRLPRPVLAGRRGRDRHRARQALLVAHVAVLFWLMFILAAALPPLAAVALAGQRMGVVTTWRRALAGLLAGSLLSTHLTILLTAGEPVGVCACAATARHDGARAGFA